MKKTISLIIAVAMLLAMLPVFSVAAANDLLSGAGAFNGSVFGTTAAPYDATVDHTGLENSGSSKLDTNKTNFGRNITVKAGTIYTATAYVMFEEGENYEGNGALQFAIYEANSAESSNIFGPNHRLTLSYNTEAYARGQWHKITVSFKTDVDTATIRLHFIYGSAGNGALWVDDVTLAEHDFVDNDKDTYCDLSYYDMTGINGNWNSTALLNACTKSCAGMEYLETDLLAGKGSDANNYTNKHVDITVDHTGTADSNSLKLETGKTNSAYNVTNVKAGTVYTATFYMMFAEGTYSGNGSLQLSIYEAAEGETTTGANHRIVYNYSTSAYARGVWHKVVINLKSAEDTNHLRFFFNNSGNANGALYIDDLTLTEHQFVDHDGDCYCDISYVDMTGIAGVWNTTALLTAATKTCAGKIQLNETDLMKGAGSFNGSAEDFVKDYYDATVDRLGNANSGSLKLEKDEQGTDRTNSAFILENAKPGAVYTARFYLMFEEGEFENDAILGFRIYNANADETETLDAKYIENQYRASKMGRGTWSQEISITFKAAEYTDKIRVHFLNYFGDRGAAYIDDVILVEHLCSDISGDGYCDCEFYDMTGLAANVGVSGLPNLVTTCGALMPAEDDLMNAAGYFNGSASQFQNGKFYDGTVDRSDAEGSGSLKLTDKTNAAYIMDVEAGGIYTANFYVLFEAGEEFTGNDALQLSIYESAAGETSTSANHRILLGYSSANYERGVWSQKISVSFKTAADSEKIRLHFNYSGASGAAVWIDDVTIVEHIHIDENGDNCCDGSYYDMTNISGSLSGDALTAVYRDCPTLKAENGTWNAEQIAVALTEGEGFVIEGSSSVEKFQNYTFTVTIAEGYKKTENFAVKVNGQVVEPVENIYVVYGVEAELIITVEGVEAKTGYEVEIVSWNLSLGDDLSMNFYVQVDDKILENAYIEIAVANADPVSYKVSEATKTEDGYYVFAADVAAAQMTDTVTLQLVVGEEKGEIYSYSVIQYAQAVLANESLSSYHALVKEMLNYGAAAQTYFNYNTENVIDKTLYAGAGAQNVDAAAAPEMGVDSKVAGVSFYGATLLFKSKTTVRFYFTVNGSINDYTFKRGEQTLKAEKKDGLYYVEVADINPQALNETVAITVTCGEEILTVSYSPMNYIVRMSEKGSDNLKALMKAMYNYHLTAKALVENA